MNNSCFFCGIIGIIINLLLTIIKIYIGIISNSISIIIDAFNSLFDMSSSIILVVFNKKKEYIQSLIISILMIIMSVIFIYNSTCKIINHNDIYFNKYIYIILIVTFILKIIQYGLYKYFYMKENHLSIKLIIVETRNDIISNFSIIASIIIMNYYNINIDGYLGLIVSLFIYISSIKMLYLTINNMKRNNKMII